MAGLVKNGDFLHIMATTKIKRWVNTLTFSDKEQNLAIYQYARKSFYLYECAINFQLFLV